MSAMVNFSKVAAISCEGCGGTGVIVPMYGRGGRCGACVGRGFRMVPAPASPETTDGKDAT